MDRTADRPRVYSLAMAKKNQPVPKSFEEAIAELEQIVTDIENGSIGLEQSLEKYERGNFLIQHCRGVLGSAEKQIEMLSKNAEGELESKPAVSNEQNPA